MQYRKLPKGTEQISVLGIGTSSIQASSEKEMIMPEAPNRTMRQTATRLAVLATYWQKAIMKILR